MNRLKWCNFVTELCNGTCIKLSEEKGAYEMQLGYLIP